MSIAIKRIYDTPESGDGTRVLVDRLWPRGIAKDKAKIDLWLKDVAPSNALRKWFGHDPEKWPEFQRRYQKELNDNTAFAELKTLCGQRKVTLLYAAKDQQHNNAVALHALLSLAT